MSRAQPPTPAWVILLVSLTILAVRVWPPPTSGPSLPLHSTLLDADLPGATPASAEQVRRLKPLLKSLGARCGGPVEIMQSETVGKVLAQVRRAAQSRGDPMEEYRDAPALTAFGIRGLRPLLVVGTPTLVLICAVASDPVA